MINEKVRELVWGYHLKVEPISKRYGITGTKEGAIVCEEDYKTYLAELKPYWDELVQQVAVVRGVAPPPAEPPVSTAPEKGSPGSPPSPHCEVAAPEATILTCPECGRQCGSPASLATHVAAAHRGRGPVNCPECGLEIKKAKGLPSHLRFKHGTRLRDYRTLDKAE